MDVQFVCGEEVDLTELLKAYPDLWHDETYDGEQRWGIGKCGDEYWDAERDIYDYGQDGPEDLSVWRDMDKEWLTWEAAAEFCGFAETLIASSDTLLEGNGPWAQDELRKEEDYLRGAERAREILKNDRVEARPDQSPTSNTP